MHVQITYIKFIKSKCLIRAVMADDELPVELGLTPEQEAFYNEQELSPKEQSFYDDVLYDRDHHITQALAMARKGFYDYMDKQNLDLNMSLDFRAAIMYMDDEQGDVPGVWYTIHDHGATK